MLYFRLLKLLKATPILHSLAVFVGISFLFILYMVPKPAIRWLRVALGFVLLLVYE